MSIDRRILANMVKHVQMMPDDPFTPMLDEYLVKRAQEGSERAKVEIDLTPRHRPGKRLSPSSIGGCERAAVFQFAGLRGTKRLNPDTELIFETGDWFHHKWQTLFRDMEIVLGKKTVKVLGIEEAVSLPQLYIAGRLDIRVKVRIKGKWRKVTIDVKSINERGWANIAANAKPVEEHVRQVTTYMAASDCDMGCLLYENKNTNQVMFFLFEFDEKVWATVQLWCERVIKALNDQKLPAMHPECDHGNFSYERCPHKGLCYGTMTKPAIKALTFKDFPGVNEMWERGLAEEW